MHWGHLVHFGRAAVCLEAQQPEALLHAALGQAHLLGLEGLGQLGVDLAGALHDMLDDNKMSQKRNDMLALGQKGVTGGRGVDLGVWTHARQWI